MTRVHGTKSVFGDLVEGLAGQLAGADRQDDEHDRAGQADHECRRPGSGHPARRRRRVRPEGDAEERPDEERRGIVDRRRPASEDDDGQDEPDRSRPDKEAGAEPSPAGRNAARTING